MLDLVLHCIAHTLTLVATQCDARIGSNSILVFPPCVWSQKFGLALVIFACLNQTRRNAWSGVSIVNLP